jgi:hypothetical protein
VATDAPEPDPTVIADVIDPSSDTPAPVVVSQAVFAEVEDPSTGATAILP